MKKRSFFFAIQLVTIVIIIIIIINADDTFIATYINSGRKMRPFASGTSLIILYYC